MVQVTLGQEGNGLYLETEVWRPKLDGVELATPRNSHEFTFAVPLVEDKVNETLLSCNGPR